MYTLYKSQGEAVVKERVSVRNTGLLLAAYIDPQDAMGLGLATGSGSAHDHVFGTSPSDPDKKQKCRWLDQMTSQS
jgi:hypothetical protein